MAVRRCRCGYTTDDVFAGGCPICLRPMGLVNDAGPPPDVPAPVRSGVRRAVPFLAVGVVVAVIVGVLGFSGQFPKPSTSVTNAAPNLNADSTGRIRIGMHIGRAARELEPVAVRNEPGRTLGDVLPRESTATGQLVCRTGRRELRVVFENGYVTSLQERAAPAGEDDWAEVTFTD